MSHSAVDGEPGGVFVVDTHTLHLLSGGSKDGEDFPEGCVVHCVEGSLQI